jgi:ribosomal protein L37E
MGGKLFRLDESLSFCENCGQKVFSRNDNCTCGYLPIQNDNSLLEINSNLIFPYEKKYCKDCGKSIELISDFKEDIVNEETGEVITVFPHFCNLKSPTYP